MINLKKKEFVIYAIALMLVAAGYFNYLNFDSNIIETSSEANEGNIIEIDEKTKNPENKPEEKKEDNAEDKKSFMNTANHEEQIVETSEKTEEDGEEQNNTNIGDAILVSNNETNEKTLENERADNQNYYAASKLERNQMYAEMIKNYENIISNTNSTEIQKSIATEEISKINNTKNAIMICENLIHTKGFNECVIMINEPNVNIVVDIEGGLNTERVSQIQNIISRELSTEIENIHITEK